MSMKPSLALAAALALAACSPAPDPAAQAAAQSAANEQAAEAMAKQFEAEFGKGNWGLARAHGDVLMAQHADTQAAARIKPQYEEAKAKAEAEREQRRLASLWMYQTERAGKGEQLSAAIYAKEPVDTGAGAKPVRLIFRDHPEWGDSSYLTLEGGDFNCYGGCKVKVTLDDGKPRSMAASRPDTDEAIAMFIEDEKALWKMAQQAERTLAVEFPVKAGGTRTAVFEVGELQPQKLPGWN